MCWHAPLPATPSCTARRAPSQQRWPCATCRGAPAQSCPCSSGWGRLCRPAHHAKSTQRALRHVVTQPSAPCGHHSSRGSCATPPATHRPSSGPSFKPASSSGGSCTEHRWHTKSWSAWMQASEASVHAMWVPSSKARPRTAQPCSRRTRPNGLENEPVLPLPVLPREAARRWRARALAAVPLGVESTDGLWVDQWGGRITGRSGLGQKVGRQAGSHATTAAAPPAVAAHRPATWQPAPCPASSPRRGRRTRPAWGPGGSAPRV